jgi:ParB/RepB/Spo0J family partition protein
MTTTLASDLDAELAAEPAIPAESTGTIVLDLPLDLLVDNPANPRRDLGDLTTLADSILSVGLLEPLVVVRAETYRAGIAEPTVEMDDGRYVLVAGHRRKAAARAAGLTEVPCVLREDLTGAQARMAMLLENLERTDLTVLEEAQAYAELVALDMSQDEIATRVGRSQSHISKRLDLLQLPEEGRQLVLDKTITLDEARALVPLADQPKRLVEVVAKKASWQSLKEVVAAELKKDADKAAYQQAVENLKAKGLRTLKAPSYDSDYAYIGVQPQYWTDGDRARNAKKPARLDKLIDAKRVKSAAAHRKLTCHAVAVQGPGTYGRSVGSTLDVCTDWEKHAAPVDQDAAAAEAEREAARAEYQRALSQRQKAREEHLRGLVAAKKPAREVTDYLLWATLDTLTDGYGNRAPHACDLLGLEGYEHPRLALYELAHSSTNGLLRAAAAVRLADDVGRRQKELDELLTATGFISGPEPQDPDEVPRAPLRFAIGDRVVVTAAGPHNGAQGQVAEAWNDDDDGSAWYEVEFAAEGDEEGGYVESPEAELAAAPASLPVESDGSGDALPHVGQAPFEVGHEVTFTDPEYSDSRGVIRKIEDREAHNSPDSASYGVEVDGDKGVTTWFTVDELQHVAVSGCTGCGCSLDGPCGTEGHCADADGYPTCELLEGDTTCSACPGVLVETVEVEGEVL